MSTAREFHHEAARCVAEARAIHDRYDGKNTPMPMEDAHVMEALLQQASVFNRKAQLEAHAEYLAEPQYRHDMRVGGGHEESSKTADSSPSTKSFLSFVRRGEVKADLVENATGLTLVTVDYAGTILKELAAEAVIRSLAFVRPTTKERVDVGAVSIGTPAWGRLETGAVAPDGLGATPASKQTIRVHDLTALVKIGRDELEDSDENLAEIVRTAVAAAFSEVEDAALAGGAGDASDQPFGIVSSTANPITQNVTAAASETVTADELKALTFKVSARFRKRGVFVADSSVEQAVALLKDGEGRYLLQPSASAGEPHSLFGYGFHVSDGLPAMSTTAASAVDPSCVFGDVASGYMIADRRKLSVLRLNERYAEEGKIGLLFTHRVGGDVIRPGALAVYKL